MLQNNNKYKVLKNFLFFPNCKFGLREISRTINLSLPSVKNYLLELEKENLIIKSVERGNPVYSSNRDLRKFKFYQSLFMQYELFESGLIDFLRKELAFEAIIFYGSYRKGEAIDDSDIDLFVIGNKKKLNLEKYQKKIGKKIHLIIDKIENVSKELKNNLINGILLDGYLKI